MWGVNEKIEKCLVSLTNKLSFSFTQSKQDINTEVQGGTEKFNYFPTKRGIGYQATSGNSLEDLEDMKKKISCIQETILQLSSMIPIISGSR